MKIALSSLIIPIVFLCGLVLGKSSADRWWTTNQRYNTTFIQHEREKAIEVYEICRDDFHAPLDECREAGKTNFSPNE